MGRAEAWRCSRQLFRHAVEHPADAEKLRETAPVETPEHVLECHLHFAARAECGEKVIGFGARVGLKIDLDIVSHVHLMAHRFGRVRTREHVTAQRRVRDVHDELSIGGGRRWPAGAGRAGAETQDGCDEFGFEDGLVDEERLSGAAGKIKIGGDAGHGGMRFED